MININKLTLALVVSDIHIGNEYSRIEEFTTFLKNIYLMKIDNKLPFLKALIILGDLFDLNASNFEDLCSNKQYFRIYKILDKIKNTNIETIITLGNHEISTSGFYNLQFSVRKEQFVNQFINNSFLYNFLSEENLCQYLVLTSEENNTYLGLIDSIYEDPFRGIHLINRTFLNQECYFMTHGYQFEDKDYHHLITGLWDIGKIFSKGWKRVVTSLWRDYKNTFKKREYSRFYKNITTSQEDIDSPFSHIIFGHTHNSEIKDKTKINLGCWLNDKNPYFLEIHVDGTCNLHKIFNNK